MLAPLRFRDYRLLVLGQMISALGDAFYAVAMPWYMLTQGGGPANLGLVLTAYGIPMGAMTLLGGWLSDKLRPRRVMLASDFARFLVVGALAWATLGVHAPLWLIGSFTATLGILDGLFIPASMAVAPDLLPDEQLPAANGVSFGLMRVAQMVGPALGGIVVSRVNVSMAFAVDAVTFVVSTATLLFIRNRVSFPHAETTPASDEATTESAETVTEASEQPRTDSLWRFALGARYLFVILLVAIVANLVNGVALVAIPALAQTSLHAGAQGYGYIEGAFGAGALLGAVLAGALGNRIARGMYSLHVFAIQSVAIFALAFSFNTFMAMGCMLAFGVCNAVGNVTFMTLLQRRLPRHLLGRAMGVLMFANFATLPLSVAASGFATARFGAPPVIMVGAALLLLGILIGYTSRHLREM